MEKPKVSFHTVPEQCANQRADNFLVNFYKGVPKTRLYRALRKGEVRRNGGRIAPSERLQAGDCLRLPPLRVPVRNTPAPPPSQLLARVKCAVLFEDDILLVLNKPAGIAVHGGTEVPWGVIELFQHIRAGTTPYLALCHRIDKATSGCLVLSKDPVILKEIHELFQARLVKKTYCLRVEGCWPDACTEVNLPLLRDGLHGGERRVCVDPAGKQAVTGFKKLAYCERTNSSLLEAVPMTGRMHQIRVHAAEMGHPILGDKKYGGLAAKKAPALCLHAAHIALTVRGQEYAFSAALPVYLQAG